MKTSLVNRICPLDEILDDKDKDVNNLRK